MEGQPRQYPDCTQQSWFLSMIRHGMAALVGEKPCAGLRGKWTVKHPVLHWENWNVLLGRPEARLHLPRFPCQEQFPCQEKFIRYYQSLSK